MKVFAVLSGTIAGILSLIVIIWTFWAWITLWGAGGAIFSVFLFPVAVLGFPLANLLFLSGDWASLLDYLFIAGALAMWMLMHWFNEKHERLKQLR